MRSRLLTRDLIHKNVLPGNREKKGMHTMNDMYDLRLITNRTNSYDFW